MNNSSSARMPEPLQQADQHKLQENVNNLRSNLSGFSVLDKAGECVGQVRDVVLDAAQHLCLVVARTKRDGSSHVFSLPTRVIEKVNKRTRSLLITLDQNTLATLPAYQPEMVSPSTHDQPAGSVSHSAGPVSHVDAAAKAVAGDRHASDDFTFPLLEERLQVNYNRRKIGEVIVRKTIETRMMQVPVRYEKLLIEQVSPEQKPLAEVDLASENTPDLENQSAVQTDPIIRGEFTSPRVASQLLDAIAKTLHHHCKTIHIELELDDPKLTETYQDWFDQYSDKNQATPNS